MHSLAASVNPYRMETDDPGMTIAKLSALTPAEQAVLDQALTGIPAREIAERMSLSEATVRSHLSSIYVKLGVSGRVALLAHFRGSEMPLPQSAAPARPRLRAVSVVGWSWGVFAVLAGAYAVYLLSHALAYGGTQAAWMLALGFGVLAALTTRLSRSILERPSRRVLLVSLAAAAGCFLYAIRGMFIGELPPSMILGVIALALGWISFRARSSVPD